MNKPFRTHFKEQEKTQDKPDVKLILDIMKNEFNRSCKQDEEESKEGKILGPMEAEAGPSGVCKTDTSKPVDVKTIASDDEDADDPAIPNTAAESNPSTPLTTAIVPDEKEDKSEMRLDSQSEGTEDIASCGGDSALCESPLTVRDEMTETQEEDPILKKNRLSRKRELRSRSAARSDSEPAVACRKRSIRRWSKEGESVLQNAIARKEKSFSIIGNSDEDKALKSAVVRSLRETKSSGASRSRAHSKSRGDNASGNGELSSESRGRNRSSKSPHSVNSDSAKTEPDLDGTENHAEIYMKSLPVKADSDYSTPTHTKTGKRRHKPFRGLRYSFTGSKKSKVMRRSAPSECGRDRNSSKERPVIKIRSRDTTPSNSSAQFEGKQDIDMLSVENCRSNSPAIAEACTSKSKKIRRDDPTRSQGSLAPSPSPADIKVDPSDPESTAISFGAGTAALCLCQVKTQLYVRNESSNENDVSLMCQAVDSMEGRLIGCCNAANGLGAVRLFRPSPRVPYVVLCEPHQQRLFRHNCCPGCGNYCTQGRFVQCSAMHHYHRDCELMVGGKPQCPHCGLASPSVEVTISVGQGKHPVFLPEQKLIKKTPTARMKIGSQNIVQDRPTTPPLSLMLTLPRAASMLDKGDREKLEKLMNGSSSERSEGRSGHLPRFTSKHLYQAAKAGDSEKIVQILRGGINPNHIFREIAMRTALHAAAARGHNLAVHVLVQAGAQLDPQDSDLLTPLMLAAMNGHTRTVQYLVKAGASVTLQGADGMTALHLVAKQGDLDSCHYLLSGCKAPLDYVDVMDEGGWTALVWSCEFQHVEVARYLLEKRADPMIRDREENVALHWAAYSGSEEISEFLLNRGCDVNCLNAHGDSPLHIAARQDKLPCVMLFLARGIKCDLVNGAGQLAVDCGVPEGDCQNAIRTTSELRKMTRSAKERTHRILTNDVSRGKEEFEIQCLNAVDNDGVPTDYVYVTENCFTTNISVDRTLSSMQSCECDDMCMGTNCKCTQLSLQSWYDSQGCLLPDFNFYDPPMLFECNELCLCNTKLCKNRVVQRGMKARFQLFRTVGKGWGVKTLTHIPKGTYVCEYIGEIISDCEADQREDDSYLFDLDNRDGETYCIDACRYGNIARFINHMCVPNLQPVRVFMGHHDLHFPRIAFFANRDIMAYEELGFDYGEKFWIVKCKSFFCTCGAVSCKYSKTTIQQTLDDYRQKLQEEVSA